MRRMTIIGILLIVAGIVIGVGLFGGGISLQISKDPETSNEGIITSSGGTIELDSGTHQIWIKDDVTGPINIRGPKNVTYTVEKSSEEEEYDDISLYGKFDAKESGEYRFEYAGTGDLYLTEDFSMGTFMTMMISGIIAGIIVILIGSVLIFIGIKRQMALDQSSFFQEAPTEGPGVQQGPTDEGAGGP